MRHPALVAGSPTACCNQFGGDPGMRRDDKKRIENGRGILCLHTHQPTP